MPYRPKVFSIGSKRDRHAERTRYKGSAQERGYDQAWRNLRNAFVAEHPCCVQCQKDGVITVVGVEVDHIKPFRGMDDPLRLDWNNLQTLCKSHHQSKTVEEQRKS